MRIRITRYAAAAALGSWLASVPACRPVAQSTASPDGHGPILAEPDPVQFGDLGPEEHGHAVLTLRGTGRYPTRVERVESSCPCVRVGPLPAEVGPSPLSRLQVDFDPSEEPGFRGRLGVELTGYGRDDIVLFRCHANVGVFEK